MIKRRSGVIIFVTGSPARAHVPGTTAIGAAFGAIENITENLAFEVGLFGVRVVCLRTLANRQPVHSGYDALSGRPTEHHKRPGDGAHHAVQFSQDLCDCPGHGEAAVLIASDRARMLTGTSGEHDSWRRVGLMVAAGDDLFVRVTAVTVRSRRSGPFLPN
jgi:NAD(P)-dependent dehydrogenase (short-subunit alcohol dehydrogenase family)